MTKNALRFQTFFKKTFLSQREDIPQVKKLILITRGEMTRQELQDSLSLSDRMNFLNMYLRSAIESGLIELTFPDKPKSRNQRYRLTKLGEEMKLYLILTTISENVMEIN